MASTNPPSGNSTVSNVQPASEPQNQTQASLTEEQRGKAKSDRKFTFNGTVAALTTLVALAGAIIGAIVSAWTPIGDYLKSEFDQTKVFSERMKEAVADLSSQEEKDGTKSAMSLVTLYPLTDDLLKEREDEAKTVLIKLALLNGSDPVLKALTGLVGKDQVAQEIISSEEISDLVATSTGEAKLSNLGGFLLFGDSGAAVEALQGRLIDEGYLTTSSTGYFGPETQEAIIRFQIDNGFYVDGIASPSIFSALGLEVQAESRIEQVPDYQDFFEEESQSYRSILLKQAVSKGQTGWIYLGIHPESMREDSAISVTPKLARNLKTSVIDLKTFLQQQIDAGRLTLAKDVYLREHRPQSQRLGRTIGILGKDSVVSIQRAFIYRATSADSRVWAQVTVESIPFDSTDQN